MESMIFGASIAVVVFGLLVWRYLASGSKLHNGAARRIFLSSVAGAAIAHLFTSASLLLGFVAGSILGLWLSYKRFNGPVRGCAADVINDTGKMRALAASFDPGPFIQKARRAGRDEIFMGLAQNRKPVLFPRSKLDKNHVEILGESGVGKSSLAGVLLAQFASAGESVIVLDPKGDRMLPGVLARAASLYGFPVTYIDLRFGQPLQLNPFLGARRDQVEELLQVALELGRTGSGAVDFYRGNDREATGYMAEAFADGEASMPELLEKSAGDERVTQNDNLWREFRQIARVPAFNVRHGQDGHDLEELIQRGGVIYITGSTTRLEVQAAQKLLLQRVMQIVDERRDQSRPVAIFLDELKYILSPAALRAAGTIRDRNVHLLFAHQSIGDLSDCPGLDPKAVRGAIWGNSGIKIAYKMLDAETARELSLISGDRAVLETRTTENHDGVSVAQSIGKASHMPAHIFTHLPKPAGEEASVGVVIGDGPAYFLATRWLEAGPPPEPIPVSPLLSERDATVLAESTYAAVEPAPVDVRDSSVREADFGDLLR